MIRPPSASANSSSARLFWPAFVLLVSPLRASAGEPDAETFFETKIRPVLAGTCFKCHGGKKVANHLRVDSRAALLKGGTSGPALVPGEPQKSLLIQAIRHEREDLKMPPDRHLAETVVADFTQWVKDGAVWPKGSAAGPADFRPQAHWAFEPILRVEPPSDPTGWAETPVDRFVSAKLREQGLRAVGTADKRTLLRRVTFDLIGLPPTLEEMTQFLADESPNAFVKVVDRLLASPHYGERWGRHWMDVVRYADTAGDNADYPIPEVRLYRDYIIDSLNADKPYDQFVQEQVAGDILAKQGPRERYAEQVIATGFLALSRRYATGPYEFWHLTLEDTIETSGRTFMGLTLRCARCHDHKFDPVTQEDYYALYGIFASTQFPWAGAEELASKKMDRLHFVPLLPPAEAAPRLAPHEQRVKQLRDEIQEVEKQSPLAKRLAELGQLIEAKTKQGRPGEKPTEGAAGPEEELKALQKEREAVNGQLQAKLNALRNDLRNLLKPGLPADLPGAYAVQEGKPADAFVHLQGEIDKPGPIVKRDVPKFLSGSTSLAIPAGASGRLPFAQWLTRRDHPLTARVLVNRLWQHHFGKGIVATPSNFGARGEPPTHPKLLDWLAAEFIDSGWSVKAIHRRIVLSKTYQLASSFDGASAAKDAGNGWYWRFDRRRLDAEAIRDALLSASGKLDRTRPGSHPFPPIEKWGWTQHDPFKAVYPSNYRSVYLMTQRIQRHPYLALFDAPDANTTTEQRTSSTVPQQALFLLNNPFLAEQAEGFARRLFAASQDAPQRIELAHQWAWSRPAKPAEVERDQRYLKEFQTGLADAGVSAEKRETEAWTSYCRVLLSANEFVFLD